MKKLMFFLIICSLLCSCEKSDDNLYKDDNPDIEILPTGFSQKLLDGYWVKSIAFDNLGNAWVGTHKQGLIKYNPDETIIYNSKNSIIPDSSVMHDIEVDSKNNIYIGCEGLIKYDGNTFAYYNSSNTPIPEDFVSSLAIDSKDNVWFSSSRAFQGGIVKYDGSNWTVYTPDNSDLPVNLIKGVTIDKNDNVWLAQSEYVNHSYLVKISNDNWTVYTDSDLGFTPYYFADIEVNRKDDICGAIDYNLSSQVYHDGPQIFIFDGTSSEQYHFDSISSIKSITIDDQDNIWFAGWGGIYGVYNGQNWMIDDSSFTSVMFVEQALDNKIWIGTGNGIYIKD